MDLERRRAEVVRETASVRREQPLRPDRARVIVRHGRIELLDTIFFQTGRAEVQAASLIDLFPSRADLRRFAGERLDRLGEPARELAIDTYRKAREQRPDHPASHRLLAFALLRAGQPDEAFDILVEAVRRQYPGGRFAGVQEILLEDVGIAAAACRRDPAKQDAILQRTLAVGSRLEGAPSLRFVLAGRPTPTTSTSTSSTATAARPPTARSTCPAAAACMPTSPPATAPSASTSRARPRPSPTPLKAHYYSRGPMGYGMGKLEIVQHDGRGNLRFDERPFVIMADHAFVDLGKVTGPLR